MLRFGFRRRLRALTSNARLQAKELLTAREAAPLPPQPNARLTNPQIEAVRSIVSPSRALRQNATARVFLLSDPHIHGEGSPEARWRREDRRVSGCSVFG